MTPTRQQLESDHPELTEVINGETRVLTAEERAATLDQWEAELIAQATQDAVLLNRKTWKDSAAFIQEFTLPELAAVSLSQDPTVAALRLLLSAWPSDVWSDDPRIQMGLAALVTNGIIDETRLAAIVAK